MSVHSLGYLTQYSNTFLTLLTINTFIMPDTFAYKILVDLGSYSLLQYPMDVLNIQSKRDLSSLLSKYTYNQLTNLNNSSILFLLKTNYYHICKLLLHLHTFPPISEYILSILPSKYISDLSNFLHFIVTIYAQITTYCPCFCATNF